MVGGSAVTGGMRARRSLFATSRPSARVIPPRALADGRRQLRRHDQAPLSSSDASPADHAQGGEVNSPRWSELNADFKRSINYKPPSKDGVCWDPVRCEDGVSARDHALRILAKGGGVELAEGIFALGWRSKHTFGATAYLVLHPAGAVMVDCPRPTEDLAWAIETLAGGKPEYMLFTHTDDLAGHEEWHRLLGCTRVIHTEEVATGWNRVEQNTASIEVLLGRGVAPEGFVDLGQPSWARGEGPWFLGGDESLVIHFMPGHTSGGVCLQARGALFTGDHMGYTLKNGKVGFSDKYCKHDYARQIAEVARVGGPEFQGLQWIMPGHGQVVRFDSDEMRRAVVAEGVRAMKAGELK